MLEEELEMFEEKTVLEQKLKVLLLPTIPTTTKTLSLR